MDDHLVDELVKHGCGQLGKVRIAVYQLHEAVNIDAFFLLRVHLLHQLGAALLKLCLFRFILRRELCVPLLRQASESVVLIEFLQQRVQLVCTAHNAVKLRPAALQAALSCI